VELIRPLLRITKHDLLTFCLNQGLDYCEDSSNRKRDYTRNRVRSELIPMMETYNPNLIQTLTRFADTIREEDAFLHAEALTLFERITTWEHGGYRFSATVLSTFHVALQRRIVKLILGYLSHDSDKIDFVSIETVRQACLQQRTPSLQLNLGGGLQFVREYDRVAILPVQALNRIEFQYECSLDRRVLEIPEANVRMEALCMDNRAELIDFSNPNVAFFDVDRLSLPFLVRNCRAGDRMQLPGLNGRKKVKDIFIDLKIPPSRRERTPLLFDADGRLLWIPGIRQSIHASVDGSTTAVLRLRVIPLEGTPSY
jgi:tRNA(Ile)-lysidine synthase